MSKLISLIKACMTDNMSLFRIKNKNKTGKSKFVIPIVLMVVVFYTFFYYADMIMEPLSKIQMEYVGLTLFVIMTTIMTFIEGIYKSSNLLFNCKDDNLMFSLPIKKSTVLFVRIFKFYVFEVIFNAMFLVPAMAAYLQYASVNVTFYISSLAAIFILPIIPITISCIIGGIIASTSSKFRFKNIAQILVTTLFLLAMLFVSFNLENILKDITANATGINEIISKIYYPAGAYTKLITEFNITDLIVFIISHLAIFTAVIMILGKVYFKINSKVKAVKSKNTNIKYKIKANKPMKALIKKELNRFINTPVLVTNAGFGLVLFIVGTILVTVKFDSVIDMIVSSGMPITVEDVKSYMPIVLLGFICFTSFMTSITSSMISLEGKSITILKSLPLKPYKIVKSKVMAAILIMLPCILIGDIIVFVRFGFDLLSIILVLLASIILPFIAETIGIMVNLKYPVMDAKNDTEVVKQSMSSTISVFAGMGIIGVTLFLLFKAIEANISNNIIMISFVAIFACIYLVLNLLLHKTCNKSFENISA